MRRIHVLLLSAWLIVAHIVIVAGHFIMKRLGDSGTGFVLIMLWSALLTFSLGCIFAFWNEIAKWDAERKAKKDEPQSPPKGDWKG